ncbi:MAG: NAD-glutamate dehydrogenase [Propionicimonas sp.]|nr:NAD-glutamate dehydrogenase [Propionicimonas sp.]
MLSNEGEPASAAGSLTRLESLLRSSFPPPAELDRADFWSFCQQYLEHVGGDEIAALPTATLAGMIAAHLELGRHREPDEHRLQVVTPTAETDSWDAHGSTWVQLVTDDRPFLVDSLGIELTRQGWSLRRLFHPQLMVERDAAGDVQGLASEGIQESWIALEVYPPLGVAAAEATPDLLAGLRATLDEVAVVVTDWHPMTERALHAADLLEAAPHPATPRRVRSAIELLRWLSAGRFVFLGYREYRWDGSTFQSVSGTGLGMLRGDDAPGTFHALPSPGDHEALVLTKDPRRSRVHRRASLDYVGVRFYDADGQLTTEHRFLGLLSATAYAESVTHIPVLTAKAERLLARSGYAADSYGGHGVRQVIATYPRDELIQAEVDELARVVTAVAGLRERQVVRAFLRRDRYGQFATVQIYLPRERYNTTVRLRITDILLSELGGESLEYTIQVTESSLTRLFFTVRLADTGSHPDAPDALAEEARIGELVEQATRTWEDGFVEAAAQMPSEARGVEFSEAYTEAFNPSVAVADLRLANQLEDAGELRFSLWTPEDPDDLAHVRLKVFSLTELELSEVMPQLSVFGVDVIDERPFDWNLRGRRLTVYDFGLRLPEGAPEVEEWDQAARQRFIDGFEACWRGLAEPARMNRLVLTAGLDWRQVTWLRAISRYLQQAGVAFSQQYIASAILAHPELARLLVQVFQAKFDPAAHSDPDDRQRALTRLEAELEAGIDAVASLDHDRILRMFLAVVRACVRTNAFTAGETVALKLLPGQLPLLPEPRPAFEIFVYSPRVQGVHLRFGAVARGGLRWSDRAEDFRTEVLGLVKAQTVKNTVIVPVGAKGGFVPARLPDPSVDRQAWQAEGEACYRIFVDALLSVTDNIRDGEVVPPQQVVRYDGDDPYLVVAADKGTATFSDLANAIAVSRGFWLGDAFASGGSSGYDHKKMGITARGAWESVKHHFWQLGIDTQTTGFTVAGIGDMSGDVFGNGMLCSPHLRLVAAFDHRHIFLDPDPDAAAGFAERQRLFGLPRSSWADYDKTLLSAGGGIYPRSTKRIPVSAEVRRALGIDGRTNHLTPAELIRAILTAPVDLLFNGGIGTYVKASTQTNAEVGDKANDAVRVDGRQVRARVAAEGGNLGWTQQGRIEYAAAGGLINTDFIDNSAGVDTSDHEVNIKILLAAELAAGRLAPAERDPLLASMTPEVARLVLSHNIDQNSALTGEMSRAAELAGQQEAWMRTLEEEGFLDRGLEALPSSEEMARRIATGGALTRPEAAVLLAYTKIALKQWMLATDLPEDPYLADRLVGYFPKPLRERFGEHMHGHALAREIITTVAINRFVNSQGTTAYHRLTTETGSRVEDVIRAQLAARAIYNVGLSEVLLGRMGDLDAGLVVELRMELQRMVERAARWLLHNRRAPLAIRAAIGEFAEPVAEVRADLRHHVTPTQQQAAEALYRSWVDRGAPEELASAMATATYSHYALGIAAIAGRLGLAPGLVRDVFFALGHRLGLDTLVDRIDVLPRQVRWDAMARAALRDDLLAVQDDLTAAVLDGAPAGSGADELVDAWLAANPRAQTRIETLRQVCEGEPDLARMSVGLGLARGLLP